MDAIVKKSSDTSRGFLFGLLVDCIFSPGAEEECPLQDFRDNLSTEEKHRFVMGLSDEEVQSMLGEHKECFENILSNLTAE